MRLTNDNALGLVISCTGETSTVCHAAQQALDRTDATVVGFAHKPLNIDRQPATGDDDGDEDRYWYIPLPDVTERVEHYATRSALLQMAVLHTVVLAADPDQDALDQVFQHVEEFIQNQLDWAPANPDEGDPTPPALQAVIEIEDRHYFLARQSPFMRAATALSQEGDLGDDLVFANLGPWHQLSWLGVQAHIEFLYTNATHVNLGSVRDAVLNILYRGNAILITTVSIMDLDEGSVYDRAFRYLFQGYDRDSIDELLRMNLVEPGELRLIAFTFNDITERRNKVEHEARLRSLHQDDGLIQLPDPADTLDLDLDDEEPGGDERVELARDLTVTTAHYFLVYAILEKRWTPSA